MKQISFYGESWIINSREEYDSFIRTLINTGRLDLKNHEIYSSPIGDDYPIVCNITKGIVRGMKEFISSWTRQELVETMDECEISIQGSKKDLTMYGNALVDLEREGEKNARS